LPKSTLEASDGAEETPKVVSIKPKDDGFYQLGYRQAISDVLYVVSLLVLGKILVDLVFKEGKE
jgi:hypothetical protein